ncbi:MAG: carbohydrate ABC transporter permease, partial [Spirochaetaceae bacterium]|nr:carbohydrate ABC transporter permease [Spirochaetaceae bacterium]
LVPTFVIWSKLRLVDTFAPLCVGSLFGLPYYIFLIRQFMMGVPREYMDAAKIDGANNYSIFFRIALPQMVPVLTAIGVLQIIGQWKNLLGPVIYLRSAAKFTLAMELNKFQQMTRLTEFSGVPLTNLLMAASIVLMIPMLIVFIAGQKHFMKGLDISAGLKG